MSLPVRSELHFLMLARRQLGNEGEMGNLGGRPSKLEDDDEGGEVGETDPLWSVQITTQALIKYKGE